jgi:hypothetical protein
VAKLNVFGKIKPYLPFVPAAALGTVSLYDTMRSLGYHYDIHKIMKGRPVPSTVVRKLARGLGKITIVRNIKDANRIFGHDWINRGEAKSMLRNNDNAMVLMGKKEIIVVLPRKVPLEVIAHEIGHLRDFAAKRIKLGKKDPYYHTDSVVSGLSRMFWKPKYEREVIKMEQAAWKHVPESKNKNEKREQAIRSYQQAFHQDRGSLTGLGSIVAVLLGLAVHKKLGRSVE